jgi:catechol 2,3-dioxygenase-like lactoylglutathione lyase family enzyme
MITGGQTRLPVAHLENSLRFYVEKLGFKTRASAGPLEVDVEAGEGLVLRLTQVGPSARPAAQTFHLDLNIPLEDAVAVLDNRGVSFDGPIVLDGDVRQALFRDPDGHAFLLREGRSLGHNTSTTKS